MDRSDLTPGASEGYTLWRCPECDWRYDEARGNPAEGFAAGTALAELPDGWSCPDCGVRGKGDFVCDGG